MRRSLWLDRRFFLGIAAAIHLVCAFQSGGWYALDEHFQTLEFAGYRLGINAPADLSWEFHHRMRPALQPAVAFAVVRMCAAVAIDNPFVVSLALRLLSGVLGVLAMVLLYRALAGRLRSDGSRAWFAAISCLLWFLPYQHVRFSSENWSGACFWIGTAAAMLLAEGDHERPGRPGAWLGVGFLLGLSWVARIQSTPLIVPVLVWISLRTNARDGSGARLVALTLGGAAAAFVLGLVLDHWLYGEWTLSSWNYFRVNLLEGAAAHFGREAWWFYPVRIVERGSYPVGLAVLVAGVVYALTRPRDLVTWILLPFLVVHSLIGHKELRFLFPLVSIVPFVLVASAEWAASGPAKRAAIVRGRTVLRILWATVAINVVLLAVACLKPADPVYSLYRFLYDRHSSGSFTLYYDSENPYERARFTPGLYPEDAPVQERAVARGAEVVLEARFFKPPGLVVESWDSVRAGTARAPCLYVTRRNLPPQAPGIEFGRVYSYLPDWLVRLNATGWVERTQMWSAYEGTAVSPP